MKNISKIILAAMLLTILSGNLFAQGDAAVPFLLISPGARPGGMGEAGTTA